MGVRGGLGRLRFFIWKMGPPSREDICCFFLPSICIKIASDSPLGLGGLTPFLGFRAGFIHYLSMAS